MPYYRIVIKVKFRKTPFQGIRHLSETNINAVYNDWNSKARHKYHENVIDVEVQMLSKLCKAVQDFEKTDHRA